LPRWHVDYNQKFPVWRTKEEQAEYDAAVWKPTGTCVASTDTGACATAIIHADAIAMGLWQAFNASYA